MNKDVLERFEKYAIPVTESGCWLWTSSVVGLNEYGSLTVEGKNQMAHRLSYEHFVGSIPKGHHVLHTCDVPSCVNPSHLFTGTHADNMKDKQKKGRAAKGEKSACSKLKDKDIEMIYYLYGMGWKKNELASIFKVDSKTIRKVLNNQSWKHIDRMFAWANSLV